MICKSSSRTDLRFLVQDWHMWLKLEIDTQNKIEKGLIAQIFFWVQIWIFESLHKIEGGALALIHFHWQNKKLKTLSTLGQRERERESNEQNK